MAKVADKGGRGTSRRSRSRSNGGGQISSPEKELLRRGAFQENGVLGGIRLKKNLTLKRRANKADPRPVLKPEKKRGFITSPGEKRRSTITLPLKAGELTTKAVDLQTGKRGSKGGEASKGYHVTNRGRMDKLRDLIGNAWA